MNLPESNRAPLPPRNLPLPGMAAVALWMLALSVLGVYGALSGHYPASGGRIAVLVLSTVFALAGWGLILMRRWGWALTLAACFCSMCFAVYSVLRFHQGQWVVMGVVNLVFFLYLARSEVIERLK